MMIRDDHDEYPPMALYLEKPSKAWKQSFAQLMTEQESDFALLLWIGLTEYPKADKGLFKKKVSWERIMSMKSGSSLPWINR